MNARENHGTDFRSSLLFRYTPGTTDHLPRFMTEMAPDPRSPTAFVESLFAEFADIEKRVDWIWRRRVTGAVGRRPQLKLQAGQMWLEASIGMPADDDQPELNVSLGLLLAFDDLALRVLCEDLVLAPSRSAIRDLDSMEVPPHFIPAGGFGMDRAKRFIDYSAALTLNTVDRAELTYGVPLPAWRICQASLLSELMIAFVIFHERVHYGLGHLDLVATSPAARKASLSEVGDVSMRSNAGRAETEGDLAQGTRRVLEMQADSWAYLLLCAYCQDEDGPARRYTEYLDMLGVERDGLHIHDVDLPVAVRLCQTAASLACLAFRLSLPDLSQPDPSHPHPYTRMLYMVQKTPILSPIVEADETGSFVLETHKTQDDDGNESVDFRDLVETSIGMALTDIELSARIVDPGFTLLRYTEEGIPPKPDAWLEDLGCFWVSDDESLNEAPQTQAGLEFQFLLDLQPEIQTVLQEFQRRRFGEETSLEIGDIGKISTAS